MYFGPPDDQWLRACPKGGTERREDIEAVIWGGAGAGKKHNSIRGARAARSNVLLCRTQTHDIKSQFTNFCDLFLTKHCIKTYGVNNSPVHIDSDLEFVTLNLSDIFV